jgi:hypothetical protein
MSLLRLLTAGKCLVGQKDSISRYRMTDPRALPKFGSGKNPFEVAPKTEATPSTPASPPGEPSAVSQQTGSVDQAGAPACASASSSEQSPPSKSGGKVGLKVGNPPIWQFWETKRQSRTDDSKNYLSRSPEVSSAKTSSWIARLFGWLPGSSPRADRATPRPALLNPVKEPVQGELSLDGVRVVRNDLSDADLEVVPVKAPVAQQSTSAGRQTVEKTVVANTAPGRPGFKASVLWRNAGKHDAAETGMARETADMQATGKV